MRNLIDFIIKNSSWFLFIFLELICFYFIFTGNAYQKSAFLNSSNEIVGRVYSVSGNILSYFGLKEENMNLIERNINLQTQVNDLQKRLYEIENDSMKTNAFLSDSVSRRLSYKFIRARVVNNSVSLTNNYITLDKGRNDGLTVDMGVISQQGIVGIVRAISDNFAVVLPILNPDMKVSCKTLKSNTTGILAWDGEDPRYAHMMDYPKFETFVVGDTVITSGYSGTFPEGILVGVIEDSKSQNDDNFYSLKIKLSTDFASLKNVIIIGNTMRLEQESLEKEVTNAKK